VALVFALQVVLIDPLGMGWSAGVGLVHESLLVFQLLGVLFHVSVPVNQLLNGYLLLNGLHQILLLSLDVSFQLINLLHHFPLFMLINIDFCTYHLVVSGLTPNGSDLDRRALFELLLVDVLIIMVVDDATLVLPDDI
jgi:hypothetical protein